MPAELVEVDRGRRLFGHGTTNAFDEAAWLVLWRLGLPLDTPLDGPESAADPGARPQREQVAALCAAHQHPQARRLPDREAWLQGVPFYVDERAIVPRSLIGELLAHPELGGGIDPWLGAHTARVLDLCTGNGSLAVLAAMVPRRHRRRRRHLGRRLGRGPHQRGPPCASGPHPADRVRRLASVPDRYDLILCNPPYVNAGSMAALPAEYQAEPSLALAGGADGMDFVRQLLRDIPAHLGAGGRAGPGNRP
jgi:ribosomal protein L3 glutamine methyltransferase